MTRPCLYSYTSDVDARTFEAFLRCNDVLWTTHACRGVLGALSSRNKTRHYRMPTDDLLHRQQTESLQVSRVFGSGFPNQTKARAAWF